MVWVLKLFRQWMVHRLQSNLSKTEVFGVFLKSVSNPDFGCHIRDTSVDSTYLGVHSTPMASWKLESTVKLVDSFRTNNYIFYILAHWESILQDYIPGRAVRSASCNLICERRTETTIGARAFGAVAPKVRHDLPDSIRSSDSITSFKKKLNRYLFNQTSWLTTYSLHPSLNACLDSRACNVDVNVT